MKAVVAAFNHEKALVGAFSVITKLRMDLRFKLWFVLCEHMMATGCSAAAAREMWISSYIGPHSHMEAIKHHYLNIDIASSSVCI